MKKTTSRGIITLGFLILIFAAFLPQLKSCSGDDIVPAIAVASSKSFDIGIFIFFFPFIFAFIGFTSYLSLLFYSKLEKSKGFTIFLCILCILFLAFPSLGLLFSPSIQNTLQILHLILFLSSIIITLFAKWDIKRPCCVFIMALTSFTFFIPVVLFSFYDIDFGIWFSLGGSMAVCWGSLWEIMLIKKKDP